MLHKLLTIVFLLILVLPAYGADVKISELPAAASALGTDEIPASQSGTTYKLTINQIMTNESDPYVKAINGWVICNGTACSAAGYTPENPANKNIANGYCPLDSSILVPLDNLPTSLTGKNAAGLIGQYIDWNGSGGAGIANKPSLGTISSYNVGTLTTTYLCTYVTGTGFVCNTNPASYQTAHLNLTSLAGLSYASASFVKMTAANTFALDTTVYQPLQTLADCSGITEGTCCKSTVDNLFYCMLNSVLTRLVSLTSEINIGNCDSAKKLIINDTRMNQKITLTAATCTLTVAAQPSSPTPLTIRIYHDGTTDVRAVVWPSSFYCPGGCSNIVLPNTANAFSVLACKCYPDVCACAANTDLVQ